MLLTGQLEQEQVSVANASDASLTMPVGIPVFFKGDVTMVLQVCLSGFSTRELLRQFSKWEVVRASPPLTNWLTIAKPLLSLLS